MRGALGKIEGVNGIRIEVNNKNFAVDHDPAKVSVEQMLAALKSAGEPAKPKSE